MDKPGEDNKIFEENSKDFRIKKEFERINFYFEDLKENEKSIIMPLIQNASFMCITLSDLQEIIAEQGAVEAYQNGEHQHGVKQSAALQSYNSLIKNYAAVIKNLFSLLPAMKRPPVDVLSLHEKTEEEIEEEHYRSELEQIRRNIGINRAAQYQQWVREQENEGFRVTTSLEKWMEDHPITDEEIISQYNKYHPDDD